MSDSRKVKMARRMLTDQERERGVPIFQSLQWEKHREDVRLSVKQRQAQAHQRAIERKKKRDLKRISTV